MKQLPDSIPIFPLDEALLLPRGNLPLNIFEPRYIDMIDYALKTDRIIGMIQTTDACHREQSITPAKHSDPAICLIGCAGRLTLFSEAEENRYVITLTGVSRFKVLQESETTHSFRIAQVDWEPYLADLTAQESDTINREALIGTFRKYLKANQLDTDWDNIEKADNESLVNALSMMSPFGAREKQALLEANDLNERTNILIAVTEMILSQTANEGGATLQ